MTEGTTSTASEGGDTLTRLEQEGEIAADYLEGLLDIADLDGDIDMDVEADRASVSIISDSGGRDLKKLVGREGEVLEALQELTRLAVHRETGDRSRLMLDIAGYRAQKARRANSELGAEAAAEAKSTGQAGRTTTRRFGSSPSDSLRSPAAATASCTILRSNGVIGASCTGSPVALLGRRLGTSSVAPRASGHASQRCRASAGCADRSALHGQPGQLLQRLQHLAVSTDEVSQPPPPTIETVARSPSTSMSMSPSRSAMSSRPSR